MTMMASRRGAMSSLFLLLLALVAHAKGSSSSLECSLVDQDERDPNLKEMEFSYGEGGPVEKFMAYVPPPVTSYYLPGEAPASEMVTPMHNGLAGVFINLSKDKLQLFWETHVGGTRSLIEHSAPFSTGGTASFPGHSFLFVLESDPEPVLKRFTVGRYPDNVYVYDPYHVEGDEKATANNLKALSTNEQVLYHKLRKSYVFGEQYKKFTGRSYLVNYPKPPSSHHMWRADYFGQQHWVTSRETHFMELPSADKLERLDINDLASRKLKDGEPRLLQDYRSGDVDDILNMTLKVLSCAPRVFEIANFLSPVEVQHIIDIALGEELGLSSTGEGDEKDLEDGIRKTRTSFNSWLERERSPIIDSIYRRASDLLRIDEALLRHRAKDEFPDLANKNTIAESLQLVHYDPGQEYTAHHDFGYNTVKETHQAQRYATLLLYLNEDMVGGSTSFPRYANAESFEELRVHPEVGKAVLFYSSLPDGNMDDLSQHQANIIRHGEKWLCNLWVWSPVYEQT